MLTSVFTSTIAIVAACFAKRLAAIGAAAAASRPPIKPQPSHSWSKAMFGGLVNTTVGCVFKRRPAIVSITVSHCINSYLLLLVQSSLTLAKCCSSWSLPSRFSPPSSSMDKQIRSHRLAPLLVSRKIKLSLLFGHQSVIRRSVK